MGIRSIFNIFHHGCCDIFLSHFLESLSFCLVYCSLYKFRFRCFICHKSCDLKVANVATSILLANNLGIFSKQLRRPRYPRTRGVPEVSNGLWVNLTSETKKLVQSNKRKCGKWIVWWLSHPLVGWNGTKLQQSSINFHGNGNILDYNLTILLFCAPFPPNNSFYSTYGSCNHLLKQSFSVTRPSSPSRIHAKKHHPTGKI